MTSMTEIQATVHDLDPNLDQGDEAYEVAVVLLAALQVGAEVDRVVEFTGFDKAWVASVAERLVASGIWQDGKTACNWFDPQAGGVEFWSDVLVGQGLLERGWLLERG